MVETERALGAGASPAISTPPVDARLIAQIAHELRTPLASIRLAFDLLSDREALQAMRTDPEQHRRLIVNLGRSLDKMEQQITDLLDIGYLETNRLSLRNEPINPAELVATACERTAVLADRRNQQVDLELPDNIFELDGDRERLEQVLVNLLSYLMRVTPVGSTLTIEAESDPDELRLAIKGGGKQVSFDERERLFEPFFRVRAEGGQVQDSGLGLAIARALVQLHGGKVWLESPIEGGNTFRVSLPKERVDESPGS